MKASEEGILAGYRVVDVKVDFYDGKMHPVDSKDIAFQIAGYFAFKDHSWPPGRACLSRSIRWRSGFPKIAWAKVMGDLSSRRGKIQGMDVDSGFQLIKAHVPAKELYRYSSTLRSLTGGRGVHSEDFNHYEEMPREQEQKVVEEYKKHRQQQQSRVKPFYFETRLVLENQIQEIWELSFCFENRSLRVSSLKPMVTHGCEVKTCRPTPQGGRRFDV